MPDIPPAAREKSLLRVKSEIAPNMPSGTAIPSSVAMPIEQSQAERITDLISNG